jgi:hypothetical protein
MREDEGVVAGTRPASIGMQHYVTSIAGWYRQQLCAKARSRWGIDVLVPF